MSSDMHHFPASRYPLSGCTSWRSCISADGLPLLMSSVALSLWHFSNSLEAPKHMQKYTADVQACTKINTSSSTTNFFHSVGSPMSSNRNWCIPPQSGHLLESLRFCCFYLCQRLLRITGNIPFASTLFNDANPHSKSQENEWNWSKNKFLTPNSLLPSDIPLADKRMVLQWPCRLYSMGEVLSRIGAQTRLYPGKGRLVCPIEMGKYWQLQVLQVETWHVPRTISTTGV